MTLSLDVCGPFRPGDDYRKKARYFLVHPTVRRTASGDDPLPQSMVEALAGEDTSPPEPPDDPLLPEVQAEDSEIKEVDPKRLEEWERLEVESEDVIIKNYTILWWALRRCWGLGGGARSAGSTGPSRVAVIGKLMDEPKRRWESLEDPSTRSFDLLAKERICGH